MKVSSKLSKYEELELYTKIRSTFKVVYGEEKNTVLSVFIIDLTIKALKFLLS